MAFTLHQCLEYYRGAERKINGNVKPFTNVEYHFADARFFEEGDVYKETLPLSTSSMGQIWHKKCL